MMRSHSDFASARLSPRNVLDELVSDTQTPPPVVVFIHGGAFRMGDKGNNLRERRTLVEAGFAVASVKHRYSTDARRSAQLDDLCSDFAFLRAQAARFGIEGSRLASFGPSVGGHLSAAVGIALSTSHAAPLQAGIVWFSPMDFATMDSAILVTGIAPEQALRPYRALAAFGTCPRLEIDILPGGTTGGGDFDRPQTMAHVIAFLRYTMAACGTGTAASIDNDQICRTPRSLRPGSGSIWPGSPPTGPAR